MKLKLFLVSVCLLLIGVGASAQGEYVVELNGAVQMFSQTDRPTQHYFNVSEEELQELIDAGIVEYYEPVVYAQPLGSVNWQLANTNAAFVEKVGAQGNDIKVGVIDGGIVKYPAIAPRVLDGWDFHEGTADTSDINGHGTFVSSMIALNGSAFATESYIVPLKVFFETTDSSGNPIYTATSTDVANAIRAAVDTYDCDVINLSLSFPASPGVVKNAIDHAIDKGAVVIAAAGNDGTSAYHYPAAFDNVIGVGSTDENNTVAWFSQRNDSVHVVAPGQNVVVSPNAETNNVGSGTSYSAPMVSALAAVAKCIKPEITQTEFTQLLQDTATDLGTTGYDTDYGYGLINCEALIKEMIKDRKVYISPIKITNGSASSIMYNNTQNDLAVKNVFANMGAYVMADDTLKTGEAKPVEQDYVSGIARFMVWNQDLVPLSPVSEK